MQEDYLLLPDANNRVFHVRLCVQLELIVITVVYEMSSWMLS